LQDAGDGQSSESQQWETETISSEEDGLVIFDGGTYSRGPSSLLGTYISDDVGGGDDADDVSGPADDLADQLHVDKERLERQLTLEV
jgi:hypothetical protein